MNIRPYNFVQAIFTTSMRAALGGVVGALFLMNSSLAMAGECKTTNGHFTSQTIVGGCPSPIGFCISGQAIGGIQGPFDVTVVSLGPAPNTGDTGVVFVTTDVTIHTAKGDIFMKETGAAYLGAEGDVATIGTILGGTGQWSGATGRLRIAGLLPAAAPGVESDSDVDYEGHVCVP